MKAKVATLLLVCYAVFLIRPVVPLLTDMMAHMFWESEHMATVHYENGKYHVHIEVNDASKASNNDEPKSNNASSEVSAHFTNIAITIDIPPGKNVRLVEHTRRCPLRDGYFSVPVPPPWID